MKDLVFKLIKDGVRNLGLNENDKRLWEYIRNYLDGDFTKDNFSVIDGPKLEYDYTIPKSSETDKAIAGTRVLRWKHGHYGSTSGMIFEFITPNYSISQGFYRGFHPTTNEPLEGFKVNVDSCKKVRDSRFRILKTTTDLLIDKGTPVKLGMDIVTYSSDPKNKFVNPLNLSGSISNRGEFGLDPDFELSVGRTLYSDAEGTFGIKPVNISDDKALRKSIDEQASTLSQGLMFRKSNNYGQYMDERIQLLLEYLGTTLSDDTKVEIRDFDSSVYYKK